MDAYRYLALFISAALFIVTPITSAQETDTVLRPFQTMAGTLEPRDTQDWTFNAADGAMLSFHVKKLLGDLDAVMTITNSAGNVIMTNDDYNYPNTQDALIEGMTIPATGQYTLTVSGISTTSGDYEITMLPGFATLALNDLLDEADDWEINGPAEAFFDDDRLAILLNGTSERTTLSYTPEAISDGYIHADIAEVNGAIWQVSILARQQANGDYYAYTIDQRGQWRFTFNDTEGEQVIRDWTTHPAIVPGDKVFTLGLLVNGTTFEFFYNGQLIGRITETTLPGAGMTGLAAAAPGQTSETVLQLQQLAVTTPSAFHIPEQIVYGDSTLTLPELQRRRLIPTTGNFGLIVPESFLTHNQAGVNALPLGGALTFERFVLGTTVSWEITTPNVPAGCGLIFSVTGENAYTLAYLDQTGGAGISDRQGDQFSTGLFREGLSVRTQQRLLIIVQADQLLYYANGRLVGSIRYTPSSGGIGNAAINFEPTSTSCQFTETWVWNWDA